MGSEKKWIWVVVILLIVLGGLYPILNVERQELTQETKKAAPGGFILLPTGEVHYRLLGEEGDPLIVLVHGFSVPSYVWDPTLSALADAGYRVLAYDLYGRGYSERLKSEYDIDLFTNQLDELLSALDIIEPVVVCGLSMGGPIAARFARLHPDQVAGVIFIAPEVTQTTPGDVFPLNIPLVGEYLMGTVMEPFVLPNLQAADFAHPEKYPDWEARYRVQLQFKGTGKALLSTIRNLTKHDPEQEYLPLNETAVPLLLIWGEEDQTIGFDQIETLRQLVPDIQIEIVPDAGHLPHYEEPGIVNSVIIQFLEDALPIDD